MDTASPHSTPKSTERRLSATEPHVRSNPLSWLCWVICLILLKLILIVSNILLPVILLGQMIMLDNVILQHHSWSALEWLWLLFLPQVALLLHLVSTALSSSAREARVGGLQWISYSWIIAIIAGVLFFDTLPQLTPTLGDPFALELMTTRSIMTVMWLTPLFYAVLTFRTLRQLFATKREQVPGKRRDSPTLDAALLQDMVWHTVIDMIDIVNMMFLGSADQMEGASTQFLSFTHPAEVQSIKIAAGAFIILALFFHQQSYPSLGYIGHKGQECAAPDVVKARKRSAIISILLVDLPFFTLRTYIYALALSVPDTQSVVIDGKEVQRPQLDKWWVKNILCLMLQAMQLRFVQQAEQERSQSLRWWDLRRQGESVQGTLRMKNLEYNANLLNAYRRGANLSENKLEFAFAEMGAYDAYDSSPTQAVSATIEDTDQAPEDRTAAGEASQRSSERRRCCRCRRCWSRSMTSFNIFCHTVMGLVLGWLVAKVDFTQLVDDMVVGQGLVQ
ncbi:unnamed protein product [Effrenium voratum]|uniref:Uncharacterized protein n=1 Tax=Effrenium voratum TaxID=2562239 RepID=A0AA36JIP4_9DINO|nr:unnamed protein product [Effrenium voratum]